MSEAVRSMFSGIAKRYDTANRLLSAGRDVAWRKHSMAQFDPAPTRVLDLACGTYDCALDLAQYFPKAIVHGADFCLPMMQAGNTKRDGKAITATNGDALHLPYADDSFDAAVVAYGWRNFDDPGAALAELKRVLTPSGQLLILEFFRPTHWWPALFYGTFGRVVFPIVGGLITGQSAAYSYLRTSIQQFVSVDEATELLRQNDFAGIHWTSYFGGISHAAMARCAVK